MNEISYSMARRAFNEIQAPRHRNVKQSTFLCTGSSNAGQSVSPPKISAYQISNLSPFPALEVSVWWF